MKEYTQKHKLSGWDNKKAKICRQSAKENKSILSFFPKKSTSNADFEPKTVQENFVVSGTFDTSKSRPVSEIRSLEKTVGNSSTFTFKSGDCPDISFVWDELRKRKLSEEEKQVIISQGVKIPDRNHKFPITVQYGKNRSFQWHYLEKEEWLAYSSISDAVFCVPCLLFACQEDGNSKFMTNPYTNWTKLPNDIRKHKESKKHANAIQECALRQQIHSNTQMTVSTLFDTERAERLKKNTSIIRHIVETIILCGRQNLPLRGHRDSNTAMLDSSNPGNFKCLLQYRGAVDQSLFEHLQNANKMKHKRTQYTSWSVQNEFIDLCAMQIKANIKTSIDGKPFAIIADEVTDSSNKEQLSVCLRYFDNKNEEIREDFCTFIECRDGVTGEDLASYILCSIEDIMSLDPNLLVGQCYDGCSSMSGECKGAAAIIRKKYPKAIYTHCSAHRLSLVVGKSSQIVPIRNMYGVLDKVYFFFDAHPKRQVALEKAIDTTQPESAKKHLKCRCKTRWVYSIDALETFLELFPSIVECFKSIISSPKLWSRDSTTDAQCFLTAIISFEFIVSLVVTQKCMAAFRPITVALQGKSVDALCSSQMTKDLCVYLMDLRNKVDDKYREWFKKSTEIADNVGRIQPTMPRICGRQAHRENYPAESPLDYYKQTLTIPFLDVLISELQFRFSEPQQIRYLGLKLVPSVIKQVVYSEIPVLSQTLCTEFEIESPLTFEAEILMWQKHWISNEDVPDSLLNAIKKCPSIQYPRIKQILMYLIVLPVTSCTAERSFSRLKLLKTSLRSSMGESRLNGLALLSIHRQMDINVDEIINNFIKVNRRRLELEIVDTN